MIITKASHYKDYSALDIEMEPLDRISCYPVIHDNVKCILRVSTVIDNVIVLSVRISRKLQCYIRLNNNGARSDVSWGKCIVNALNLDIPLCNELRDRMITIYEARMVAVAQSMKINRLTGKEQMHIGQQSWYPGLVMSGELSDTIRVDPSGNVGIGLTPPSSILHIRTDNIGPYSGVSSGDSTMIYSGSCTTTGLSQDNLDD